MQEFFQAINWLLFFLYLGTKGSRLGTKCDKTHIHNSQNTKHYSPTVYYLLQYWFFIRERTGFAGNV